VHALSFVVLCPRALQCRGGAYVIRGAHCLLCASCTRACVYIPTDARFTAQGKMRQREMLNQVTTNSFYSSP
jgi:hypothetical protein